MQKLLRIVCVAAAGVIACSHARAAEKTMPINFIGEWCYSSQENKTTSYTLPSWTEDGRCTKILSIEQYGFVGDGRHCAPVNMRLPVYFRPSAHSGPRKPPARQICGFTAESHPALVRKLDHRLAGGDLLVV